MASNLSKLHRIFTNWQCEEIEGVLIDAQSANIILKVYNSLEGKNQENYGRLIENDLTKAAKIAWRLT